MAWHRKTPNGCNAAAAHLITGVECPIVTMTRVREPLEYYLSFFLWAVAYRQQDTYHVV